MYLVLLHVFDVTGTELVVLYFMGVTEVLASIRSLLISLRDLLVVLVPLWRPLYDFVRYRRIPSRSIWTTDEGRQ